MTKPQLIGLTAYATSGKDAAAEALLPLGWERRAFADQLRRFAYILNPLIEQRGSRGLGPRSKRYVHLADLVDDVGWDRAKTDNPQVREFLQRLGTDAGRQLLGENVWVNAALRDLVTGSGPVVFTDCRFPNEADAIRNLGGVIIRIIRPGVRPINGHPSETAMDGYDVDWVLLNDGSLEDLHAKMTRFVTARH